MRYIQKYISAIYSRTYIVLINDIGLWKKIINSLKLFVYVPFRKMKRIAIS